MARHHKVSFVSLSTFRMNTQTTVAALSKLGNCIGQRQSNSARLQSLLGVLGHLRIERRHHLIGQFDNRHCDSTMGKVLRHLKTDESASHDNCLAQASSHRSSDGSPCYQEPCAT